MAFHPIGIDTAASLAIHSSGRVNRYIDHFMARQHPTDHLVMWAIGGRGWAEVGGKRHAAEAGTCLVLPRGVSHRYGSDRDQPWNLLWLHLAGPLTDAWVADFDRRFGRRVHLGTSSELIDAFHEVIERCRGVDADRQLAAHLAWALLGRLTHRVELARSGTSSERHEAVEGVRRYVADHLAQAMSSDDLAKAAGVSRRQLTRLCRSAWGTSPMAYVTSQRLAQACSLLVETALPIARVAEASGFADPYHFSHAFRQHMGEPPREYRRRHRESLDRNALTPPASSDRYHRSG